MNDGDDRLAALRAEIDALDDRWMEAVARRLGLADEVARSKGDGEAAFRPGREASLIRRHIAASGLDPLLVEALLRQVMAASLARQQDIRLAVSGGDGVTATARFRFGVAAAEYIEMPDAASVIAAVADGKAGFGMLPHWEIDESWVKLLGRDKNVFIVAETPLVQTTALTRTVLLASSLPDAGGDDVTLHYDENAGIKATAGHNPATPGIIGIVQKV